MRLISCFLTFNIFYSVNGLHGYVTLASKRQQKNLSILSQFTKRYFSARFLYSGSSPAVQYLTVMKLSFENYSLKASAFTAEERFLKFVLSMVTKMPADNQASLLLFIPFLIFHISEFHSCHISMHRPKYCILS